MFGVFADSNVYLENKTMKLIQKIRHFPNQTHHKIFLIVYTTSSSTERSLVSSPFCKTVYNSFTAFLKLSITIPENNSANFYIPTSCKQQSDEKQFFLQLMAVICSCKKL